MSDRDQKQGLNERLTEGYHHMLQRIQEAVQQAEKEAAPVVRGALEEAKHAAAELGDMTREEAEKVGQFLRRDLHEAADFLARSGKELGDWLQFDLELVERGLAQMFSTAIDQTRVELDQWNRQAEIAGEWHTGEITGIGTLQCKSCGEVIHFYKIGHIPPCPKCHGTRFRRVPAAK